MRLAVRLMLQNDSFRNLRNVLNMEHYESNNKSRLGCLLTLLTVAVVVAAMVATCPDSRRHKEVVTNVMTEALNDMSAGGAADDLLTRGIRVVGDLLVGSVAETAVDKMLTVDNYFVCSIGRIHYDGNDHLVSAGILGHVFTVNKEDLTKAAGKYYIHIRQQAEHAVRQQIRKNVLEPIDEALGDIFNDIMGGQTDGRDEPGRSGRPDTPDPSSESNL